MLQNYIKIALKVLMRRKFFTAISLFGISFTLLVLNVATSMFERTLSNSDVEKNFDRILVSGRYNLSAKGRNQSYDASIAALNRNFKSFPMVENQSFYSDTRSQVSFAKNKKVLLRRRFVDSEYWNIYNFNFLSGKAFSKEMFESGERVVVISEYVEELMFNGNAIGKYFNVENKEFKIIGVVSNVSKLSDEAYSDLWIPITSLDEKLNGPNSVGMYRVAFLAKSSDDFPQIREEFNRRISKLELPPHSRIKWERLDFVLDSKFEKFARDFTGGGIESSGVEKAIAIVLGAMILFMVLPALNLVNINISRIMERSSEIGVRKSFGASSSDLVKQFLVENIILSLAGSFIAFIASKLVLSEINKAGFVPYSDFDINLNVFLIGICFAVFFGILSGVLPAYKMAKLSPVNALKGA